MGTSEPACDPSPGTIPAGAHRRAHAVLVREGYCINRKKVQRLWREERLRVPPLTSAAGSGDLERRVGPDLSYVQIEPMTTSDRPLCGKAERLVKCPGV